MVDIDTTKPIQINVYDVNGTGYITRKAMLQDGNESHQIFRAGKRGLDEITGSAYGNINTMLNGHRPIKTGDISPRRGGNRAPVEDVYLNADSRYSDSKDIPISDAAVRDAHSKGLLNPATDVDQLTGPLKQGRDHKLTQKADDIEKADHFVVKGGGSLIKEGVIGYLGYMGFKAATTPAQANGQPKSPLIRAVAGIGAAAVALRFLQKGLGMSDNLNIGLGDNTLASIGKGMRMVEDFAQNLMNSVRGVPQARGVDQLAKEAQEAGRTA